MEKNIPVMMLPRTVQVLASGRIYSGPCVLDYALLSGDGANAKVVFYDGFDASGTAKATLLCLNGDSREINPRIPILFEKGIYITVGAATDTLSVSIRPVEINNAKPFDNREN